MFRYMYHPSAQCTKRYEETRKALCKCGSTLQWILMSISTHHLVILSQKSEIFSKLTHPFTKKKKKKKKKKNIIKNKKKIKKK